ncbi:hypothetical protein IFM89_017850 [Coptis chinensis]|uniref:non-specific serine/threonine protein kinase n=1 Tax=Coptis chinensis TaxID=261450 RepID=A0A835M3S2_9MAGN|nr:hypothetical protein IFM89_017850 [Coptis chinensis]
MIENSEFSCPSWFPVGAKSLIDKILDPNPQTRIQIQEIRNDEWFKKSYVPVRLIEYEDVNLDDVYAVFDYPEDQPANEPCGSEDTGPLILNAFDLIILSQGLNLSAIFNRGQDPVKQQTRFVSQKPPKLVMSTMEVVAQSMGFKTHIRNYKMRMEGLSADKTAQFSVIIEIFEVAPSLFMVDAQKVAGDVVEYHKLNRTSFVLPNPYESCSLGCSSSRTFAVNSRISSGDHRQERANHGSQKLQIAHTVTLNIND